MDLKGYFRGNLMFPAGHEPRCDICGAVIEFPPIPSPWEMPDYQPNPEQIRRVIIHMANGMTEDVFLCDEHSRRYVEETRDGSSGMRALLAMKAEHDLGEGLP